jgi:DNA mismatch repair protein MutL
MGPTDASIIQLLPSSVVDQIAAGEVVERPAHLVKELVENALDAGATSIEVEFDGGGRRIRVTDNGLGIRAEQLKLALARHATSKITLADDLWRLQSFGFRGEALASIAAVSRLTLQSRTANSETAARVKCEFGQMGPVEMCGGNLGTTLIIEDLFENIPARLKFLKSEAGEHAQIKAVLRSMALAHESVEFRVRSKGRTEYVWPIVSSFRERALTVLDQERLFASSLELSGFQVRAVFASPHQVTGNSRSVHILVQDRPVQDRSLQHAVMEAYRGLLMHGEFPIAAVRIQAPPGEVDVNIHPTKSQVKFRDPQVAFRIVHRSLREALEKAPWLERSGPETVPGIEPAQKLSVAALTRAYDSGRNQQMEAQVLEAPSLENSPVHSIGRFEDPDLSRVQFKQKEFIEQVHGNSRPDEQQKGKGAWSSFQVLGQAHLTYILAQDSAKLIMVDQHAAHERVSYERLMRAWKNGDAPIQNLLLPLIVELDGDGAECLIANSAELQKLGLQIDQLGPQSIAVRATPLALSEKALSKVLKDLAREIAERGGSFAFERKVSDICASLACHASVRAGQALSVQEMASLLKQMDEFPLSSFCPHGRPVSIEFPFTKLERDFGRLV